MVVSTVGPFALCGSALVAAIVENGTHYCDLSAELQWMRAMIDAHEDQARETGGRIVIPVGMTRSCPIWVCSSCRTPRWPAMVFPVNASLHG